MTKLLKPVKLTKAILSSPSNNYNLTEFDIKQMNRKIKNFESSKEFKICKEVVNENLHQIKTVDIMLIIANKLKDYTKGCKKELFKSMLLIIKCQWYWNGDENHNGLCDVYHNHQNA